MKIKLNPQKTAGFSRTRCVRSHFLDELSVRDQRGTDQDIGQADMGKVKIPKNEI